MSDTAQTLLIFIPVLLVSISIHEMLHSYVAFKLGDDSQIEHGRMSLNPIHHIDPILTVALPILLVAVGMAPFAVAKPVYVNMNRVKYEEFGGAIVAMVGPLSNLVLAVVAALLIRGVPSLQSGLPLDILSIALVLNVSLFVFNSIPFPPLDGSRLLYAFAPEPLQRVMNMIERQGMAGLLIFMLVIYPVLRPVITSVSNAVTSSLLG